MTPIERSPHILPESSVPRRRALFLLAVGLLLAGTVPAMAAAPDPKEAVYARKVRAKAKRGDAAAQYEIGRLYAKGQGVWQNYPEAAKWYRRAAEQGHAEAQLSLGILYEEGTGVPLDLSKATYWYRKAAEQGDMRAQMRAGFMYGTGRGVPVNHVQAYLWYSLAAKQGNKLAAENRKAASDRLTSADLARAKALVRNWRPKKRH